MKLVQMFQDAAKPDYSATLPDPAEVAAEHELTATSITGICDHIVVSHHGRMRELLPQISELAATVVRVHGAKDSDLATLQTVFETLRSGIEGHMAAEEGGLFPACRALDDGGRRIPSEYLGHLADNHASFTAALAQLRTLSDDFDPGTAHCNAHRSLRRLLHVLEVDLKLHIHEENDLLFHRVRDHLVAVA